MNQPKNEKNPSNNLLLV